MAHAGRFDVIVRGGTVVSGGGRAPADVGIRGETIAALLAPGEGEAARTVDATGKLVLPGGIDAHNHPVYDDAWEQVSASGAAGGITTIIPFIGAFEAWGRKPGSLVETLEGFIAEGRERSLTDFGVHLAIAAFQDPIPEIPAVIKAGCPSFKFFMAYKRRGMMVSDEQMVSAMDAIAANGGMAMAHCENGAGINYLQAKFTAQGRTGNEMFLQSHTPLFEAEATLRFIALADAVGCPAYVPHITGKLPVEVFARFKRAASVPVYGETCPQYILATNEAVIRDGPIAKVGPPIREAADNAALWAALADGTLDVVGSDHAGRKREVKNAVAHIFDAAYGAPGIGTMLPMLYSEGVRKGRITLERLVQVLCENPARIFGLAPKKGALVPGADADLVVFDPEARHTISWRTQHTKSDYSLLEGRECVGRPTLVMQRGEVLVQDGEVRAKPGRGRFLPASLA